MNLSSEIVHTIDVLGNPKQHIDLLLRCDECGLEFRRRRVLRDVKRQHHYHVVECRYNAMKAGKKQNAVLRMTFNDRYGVDYPSQDSEIRQRAVETWLKTMGVSNPALSPQVQEKMKQTCVRRYGGGSGFASTKTNETLLTRYGVDNAWKSPVIRLKLKQEMLKRYGVDNAFKLPSTRKSCSSEAALKKRYETMRRNGTFNSSRVEDAYYKYLCSIYGKDDVQRWVRVGRWVIDLRVLSKDEYHQVDGIYWHGLDRPIEIISRFKHPQDVQIYASYHRDIVQTEWFKKNSISLVRITDVRVKDLLKPSR